MKFIIHIFCILIIFSLSAFAQDPAAAPTAPGGFFPWITAHWQDLISIVVAVIVLARLIVKLTPTPADDSVLEKIINVLKHVGLHIKE